MGLFAGFDRGGGYQGRRDAPIQGGGPPGAIVQPQCSAGVLHEHAGQTDIAADRRHPGGAGAMFQGIAIAARCAAASAAAVHPASVVAGDGRGAAGRAGAGACAAARGVGENVGLHCGHSVRRERNAHNIAVTQKQEQNRNILGAEDRVQSEGVAPISKG